MHTTIIMIDSVVFLKKIFFNGYTLHRTVFLGERAEQAHRCWSRHWVELPRERTPVQESSGGSTDRHSPRDLESKTCQIVLKSTRDPAWEESVTAKSEKAEIF